MARSVSSERVVQEEADDFCRLYCRPSSRMACSSMVNRMFVRLTVRGYICCRRPWGVCDVVLFCLSCSLSSFWFNVLYYNNKQQ